MCFIGSYCTRTQFYIKKVNNLKTVGVEGELFKGQIKKKVKLLGKKQLSYANPLLRQWKHWSNYLWPVAKGCPVLKRKPENLKSTGNKCVWSEESFCLDSWKRKDLLNDLIYQFYHSDTCRRETGSEHSTVPAGEFRAFNIAQLWHCHTQHDNYSCLFLPKVLFLCWWVICISERD